MRRLARRIVTVVGALLGTAGLLACASFGTLDGDDTPSNAGDGSTSADAASPTDGSAEGLSNDATSNGLDADPNTLLLYGDFSAGCGGWAAEPVQTFVEGVPAGHNGSSACRLCATGNPTYFALYQIVRGRTIAPGYRARAWLRRAPNRPAPSSFGSLVERYGVSSAIPTESPYYQNGPNVAVDDSWHSMEFASTELTADAGATPDLIYVIRATFVDGACFDVSDAVLDAP